MREEPTTPSNFEARQLEEGRAKGSLLSPWIVFRTTGDFSRRPVVAVQEWGGGEGLSSLILKKEPLYAQSIVI